MPGYNGSGTFVRTHNWQSDAAGAIDIDSTRMDAEHDGFASGLSNALVKDGQQTPTADLPMGGFKHTGVGNASARNQYAAAGQVQDGALVYAGTSSGTDTITATLSPAPSAYTTGMLVRFKAGGTNTGAATLNLNALGAKSLKKNVSDALEAGDITTDQIIEAAYDGTNFQVLGV